MEVYYTKKEYRDLEKLKNKEIKKLQTKITKLESENKKLKEDYEVLLETATETHVTES